MNENIFYALIFCGVFSLGIAIALAGKKPIEKLENTEFKIPAGVDGTWEVRFREGWYEVRKKQNGITVEYVTWHHKSAMQKEQGE